MIHKPSTASPSHVCRPVRVRRRYGVALLWFALLVGAAVGQERARAAGGQGVHLFVLSGQSNMVGLRPEESFTPTVEKALAPAEVVVVKDAAGGQPIRRWCKRWRPAKGKAVRGKRPAKSGDLYERLLGKVRAAIGKRKLQSVTFVWMQGERDAREGHGDVYAASLRRVIAQLAKDLGRRDMHFVIGRLSDFDLGNTRYPHWTRVRKAQVEVAESSPLGAWVDTDDLNDGRNRKGKQVRNDLHYSAKGYVELGRRFAEKALELLRASEAAKQKQKQKQR